MNIVIFGANGGVGSNLVERALAEGHQVTAAVRNPAAIDLTHHRLDVVPCNVLDPISVDKATAGQDVAFCAIGTPSRAPTNLYSAGARNIVRAMRAHQVRRLVFLSNFGVLGERARDLRGSLLLFLAKRIIRHTLVDHRRALDEIRGHVPEWIAVRPMALTDGPRTGRYRIVTDGLPSKGMRISRADVADFSMRQATGNDYLYKVPAIAY